MSSSDNDGDESDEEDRARMRTITIGLNQLCRKLKKINGNFKYTIINENEEWSEDHVTAELSSAKKQRIFCEDMLSEIIDWQK